MTQTTTTDLAEIKVNPRAWTNSTGADQVLRRCLAADVFPTVPTAVTIAAGAKDRLDELQRAHRNSVTTQQVTSKAVADLLAGREIDPDVFDAHLLDAARRHDVDGARMQIAGTMSRQVEAGWWAAVADGLPALLGGLRDQLKELLTDAHRVCTALGDLDQDNPAAVAAATDQQRTALQEAAPLVARYERLRIAQQAAIVVGGGKAPGYNSHLVQQPTWGDVFDRQVHELADVPTQGAIPAGLSGLARLRLLVQRDDLWLPEAEQLREAHAELLQAEAEARQAAEEAKRAEREGLAA